MKYIISNMDWVFSGIGIFILSGIINFIRKKFLVKPINNKYQNRNNNIQTDRLINNITYVHGKTGTVQKESPLSELTNKFYSIFEYHGVSRLQIPSFIDKKFNIEYSDIADENSIIPKLNEDLLSWVSLKFGIRRSWFDEKAEVHTSKYIYDSIGCYKNTGAFISLFSKLIDEFTVYGYKDYLQVYFLKTFEDFKGNSSGKGRIAEVMVIVSVEIGNTTTNSVNKYILITPNLRWDYEKSRYDIKRMIRIADRLDIRTMGYDISESEYYEIGSGQVVPRDILNRKKLTWYPEDYDGSFNDRIAEVEYEHNKLFQDSLRSIDNKICEMLEEKRQQFIKKNNDMA
ncbi:hypothetical protein [Bacillus cereus]|uniref:hypothetical protein n=1 Tax=Bacillus cereus TaxID=1396 RepID=UPI00196254D1|nr:hypothetical protein [Bacillus cereus]MBM6770844.1 hypothetical protein [Bacillus cereus]